MVRIICDSLAKEKKNIWGDDPNDVFNQKIIAVNNMYRWLYDQGILEKISFQFKDLANETFFALNVADLEPYRAQMERSGVKDADATIRHIFDVEYTPCEYSGAIQLGWTMHTYRSVDGMTGSSWECDLIKMLNTDAIYEVRDMQQAQGIKAAVDKMFSYFDWPVIDKQNAPERDMIDNLFAAASLTKEYNMVEEYDQNIVDAVDMSPDPITPSFLQLLRDHANDPGGMKLIGDTIQVLTGNSIKETLNKLAETAIDCLRSDLSNVINASESDYLTSKEQELLDGKYHEITGVIGALEEQIKAPDFELSVEHSSFDNLIQSATDQASKSHSESISKPDRTDPTR